MTALTEDVSHNFESPGRVGVSDGPMTPRKIKSDKAMSAVGAVLHSSFTRGNMPASTTCPAAPESFVTLTFTHLPFEF